MSKGTALASPVILWQIGPWCFRRDLVEIAKHMPKRELLLRFFQSSSTIFGLETARGQAGITIRRQVKSFKQMILQSRKKQLECIWARFHTDSSNTFSHDIRLKTTNILYPICWLKKTQAVQRHAPAYRAPTEQKLDCLQAMGVNKTNKKPQVFRIRSLGKTSQQDEIVNTEVRLKVNWLDKCYTV